MLCGNFAGERGVGGVWNRWVRLVGSEWKGKVEIGKHTVRNAKCRFLHIAIYIQQ